MQNLWQRLTTTGSQPASSRCQLSFAAGVHHLCTRTMCVSPKAREKEKNARLLLRCTLQSALHSFWSMAALINTSFFPLSAGEHLVRPGGLHRQHGDLRAGGGRQAGRQSGHPQAALLSAALHPRLRQLHQGPLDDRRRPLQRLHTGQQPRRLQSIPR